ncbi:MAG: imidazolonepropionase [Deltaproteobacteria bacterium]|nr:MAG: imidazolonepropionase [Deltaproteobacteria bacterium]
MSQQDKQAPMLVVRNARVVTCDGPPEAAPKDRLAIIDGGMVAIGEDGRVSYVGPEIKSLAAAAANVVDAESGAVLPGLVDPHTHLVFAGSRVDEFARRMAGEDYQTIAKEGGGIAATVRATRAASDEALYCLAARRARVMRRCGVTTLEVKSGYGLRPASEAASLRAARRIGEEGHCRVTTSFLGAHAIPPERRGDRAGYVDEVVGAQLDAVVAEGLADAIDVYIDEGAFTLAEGRRVLEAGKARGLAVRAHAGQFADLGAAELVAELGGLSADHLEELSDEGAAAMAAAGVVGVLLPGAWRTLRQAAPDVGRLRRAGVRLAVGTDLNPGTSPTTNLPLCAALAVRDAGLTLEEAVLGVTVDAAAAAGFEGVGRIAEGCWGDLAIYAHDDPRALAYGIGDVRPLKVVLGGRVVHEEPRDGVAVW